jgi:hypothetical protein
MSLAAQEPRTRNASGFSAFCGQDCSPLPAAWTIDEANDACFIVRDANGQALGHLISSGRGFPMGLDSSQRCQMRFRVAPRLDELAQIRLTRLECDVGQLASKQLVSQPNAIGVDDVTFTVVGDRGSIGSER